MNEEEANEEAQRDSEFSCGSDLSEAQASRLMKEIYPDAKGPLWMAVARALDEAEFNAGFHDYLDNLL